MVEGDSARHPRIIVVDGSRDGLVAQALRLASEHEVEIAQCDDVYSAVAEMATSRGSVLLVGRLDEMAREKGRLFALAARHKAQCCCVLEPERCAEAAGVLAAVAGGVSLVARAEEVGRVLKDWLTWNRCRSKPAGSTFIEDEFRATEAELNALLGRDSDE